MHAWGYGTSPPSDTEQMFDTPPEVSMNLGCFRAKRACGSDSGVVAEPDSHANGGVQG